MGMRSLSIAAKQKHYSCNKRSTNNCQRKQSKLETNIKGRFWNITKPQANEFRCESANSAHVTSTTISLKNCRCQQEKFLSTEPITPKTAGKFNRQLQWQIFLMHARSRACEEPKSPISHISPAIITHARFTYQKGTHLLLPETKTNLVIEFTIYANQANVM